MSVYLLCIWLCVWLCGGGGEGWKDERVCVVHLAVCLALCAFEQIVLVATLGLFYYLNVSTAPAFFLSLSHLLLLPFFSSFSRTFSFCLFPSTYCLDGLVVKASASRAEDPGFQSRLRRDFPGSSHTSDSIIGTPVATLPGAWRYRVSAGTGLPGVSIL